MFIKWRKRHQHLTPVSRAENCPELAQLPHMPGHLLEGRLLLAALVCALLLHVLDHHHHPSSPCKPGSPPARWKSCHLCRSCRQGHPWAGPDGYPLPYPTQTLTISGFRVVTKCAIFSAGSYQRRLPPYLTFATCTTLRCMCQIFQSGPTSQMYILKTHSSDTLDREPHISLRLYLRKFILF